MALPTWGQKCLVSEIEQIEKVNFDLGHPVIQKYNTPWGICDNCKETRQRNETMFVQNASKCIHIIIISQNESPWV